jgi:hypothetical protein
MKNELNLTYLVPKTLYHNLRQLLNGSQRQELDRANMSHWQEPQASALPTIEKSKQDTTAGDTTGDTTGDTFMDTTILSPPRPTASKPSVETPTPPVEPPTPPVEPPAKTPVKSPKPLDQPSPVKPPHAPDLFGGAVRRGAYYDCGICGQTLHGKEKLREHMLTHTSTPVQSVKPAKANRGSSPRKTPNNVRVEMVNKKRQRKEEEEPESWAQFFKFTS